MVNGMTDATAATSTAIRERWGKQLRLARIERGLFQTDVAEATGTTGATVSRAESGRQGSLDVYLRLAAHLGVTLEIEDDQT